METTSPLFTLLLILLLSVHALFAIAAVGSNIPLSSYYRAIWSVISLILGPLGYYIFKVTIPYKVIVEPEHKPK